MRRIDFSNSNVFRNLGERTLADVFPPYVTLYQHIPTKDCYQVNKTTPHYRRSHWEANPSAGPGPWVYLQ